MSPIRDIIHMLENIDHSYLTQNELKQDDIKTFWQIKTFAKFQLNSMTHS